MGIEQIQQELIYKVDPEFEPHKELEIDVREYLEAMDFITHSSAYHDVMDQSLKELLTHRWSPTALYIRARADRIAVHKSLPIEFEYDLKTKDRKQYSDLLIEILPVVLHKIKSMIGIKCLFCCRVNGYDRGFWIEDMPNPIQFNLPPLKKNEAINPILKEWISEIWPDIWIDEEFIPGGSGDPYLKIENKEYRKLPHWRELVDDTFISTRRR
jgi:hypothetical protein